MRDRAGVRGWVSGRVGRWTSEGSDDIKPNTASEANGSIMRCLAEVRKGFDDGDAFGRRVHAMLWSKELQRRSDRFKTLLKILLPRLRGYACSSARMITDHSI